MSNFCWLTLLNQFKLSDEALYEWSDVKLVYVGHHMFMEIKHIHQPKPQVSPPPTAPSTGESGKKKPRTGRKRKKVTSHRDIPKLGKKSPSPSLLPPAPQPTRRSRRKIDYLQLNDGLENPVIASPKPRKQKPYSPPLRDGPSSTRQAANKHAWSSLDLEDLMEETVVKLPDLVRRYCT